MSLPVVADSMRTGDRFKPQKRLEPRPEALPKPQISRTVRGVEPAKKRRSTATCTPDAIGNNRHLISGSFLADGALNLDNSTLDVTVTGTATVVMLLVLSNFS